MLGTYRILKPTITSLPSEPDLGVIATWSSKPRHLSTRIYALRLKPGGQHFVKSNLKSNSNPNPNPRSHRDDRGGGSREQGLNRNRNPNTSGVGPCKVNALAWVLVKSMHVAYERCPAVSAANYAAPPSSDLSVYVVT